MKGIADVVELDDVFDDVDDSGPVYAEDEIVLVVPPMPRLMLFVLAEGEVEDKLVEYEELGSTPCGI